MSLKQEIDLSKEAQTAFGSQATIIDLLAAIRNDTALTEGRKAALLIQLNQSIGSMPKGTPLGSISSLLFGSVLGNLISKYFGMGMLGRTVSSIVGAGIGKSIYNRLTERQPGYRMV